MPYIETPEELAEELADKIGVYGAHAEGEKTICRVCFTSNMADHIRKSVANQKKLLSSAGPNNCPECGQFFDSMGELCDECAKRKAGIPIR